MSFPWARGCGGWGEGPALLRDGHCPALGLQQEREEARRGFELRATLFSYPLSNFKRGGGDTHTVATQDTNPSAPSGQPRLWHRTVAIAIRGNGQDQRHQNPCSSFISLSPCQPYVDFVFRRISNPPPPVSPSALQPLLPWLPVSPPPSLRPPRRSLLGSRHGESVRKVELIACACAWGIAVPSCCNSCVVL